jgi:hypothetical protein
VTLNGQRRQTVSAVELTTEEKIAVIQSHVKNVQYNKYNAQITLVAENALETPDADKVASANEVITKASLQLVALQAEIDALSA